MPDEHQFVLELEFRCLINSVCRVNVFAYTRHSIWYQPIFIPADASLKSADCLRTHIKAEIGGLAIILIDDVLDRFEERATRGSSVAEFGDVMQAEAPGGNLSGKGNTNI